MKSVLVRFTGADIFYSESHDHLMLAADLDFETGGGAGGFGLDVDKEFIAGVLGAAGVDSVTKLNGKTLRFNYSKEPGLGGSVVDGLISIAPLWKKDGIPFRFDLWREKRK